METNFNLEITVIPTNEDKMPDVLAYVYLKFIDAEKRSIILNGSTLRKSKFGSEPCLIPASRSKGAGKGFYKFIFCENKDIWEEIKVEAISKYKKKCNSDGIPIIEETGSGAYKIAD